MYPSNKPGQIPSAALTGTAKDVKNRAKQANRVTPTPSRTGVGRDPLDDIPDLSDELAERPNPGHLRLSAEAIDGRLRRVFQPNCKGEYKVSMDIVQQWKNKKTRKPLEQLFQRCGFNSDMG